MGGLGNFFLVKSEGPDALDQQGLPDLVVTATGLRTQGGDFHHLFLAAFSGCQQTERLQLLDRVIHQMRVLDMQHQAKFSEGFWPLPVMHRMQHLNIHCCQAGMTARGCSQNCPALHGVGCQGHRIFEFG